MSSVLPSRPLRNADGSRRWFSRPLAQRLTWVVVGALVAVGCTSGGGAWFDEESVARGIDFTHVAGQVGERHLLPEAVAGGGALFDMDGDGDLDAYFVQGGDLGESVMSLPNRLYENLGDGSFRPLSEAEAGDAGDRRYGMGAACADVDDDGDVDLYVSNYGRNTL